MADEDWFSANAPPQQPEQDWFAQNAPKPVSTEEPSIPAKIGHAVVDTLKGFLPQSVGQAALAPITMVPGIGKVGQLLSNVAFGKPIGEGLDPLAGIPIVQRIPQIAAAEKTSPYSQERFTAGIGTLADVAMLAGFKDVFNPKLAETAGIAKPDIAQPVEPVATDVAKTEPIGGDIHATQERQVAESIPAERQGNDAGGTPTETGVSGSVQPEAQVQQQAGQVEPLKLESDVPRPEPQIQPTFSVDMPTDAFGTEQTPVASALQEMGGVLSKSGAKKAGKLPGNEALWNDVQSLSHPTHNKIYGTEMPDVAAQTLHDAGLINDPSVQSMWKAVADESKSSRNILKSQKSEIQTQQFKLQETNKQTQEFGKAQKEGWKGGEPVVPVRDLQVGDHVEVKGERLKVVDIDPDNFDVTLEDGRKFGVQTVKDGTVIYGQHETPAAAPKLLPGETQGDLISSTQKEPLALVGEKGTDFGAQQAATEQAAAERAQSEKGQTDFLQPEPSIQGETPTGAREGGSPQVEATAPEVVEPTAPPAEPPTATGVHAAALEERPINAPPPGEVTGWEANTEQGHDWLDKGGDPQEIINKFEDTKAVTPEDMGRMRAALQRLQAGTDAAGDALRKDPGNPELETAYQTAKDAEQRFTDAFKPMHTFASANLGSLKGKIPFDEGAAKSFTGMHREFQANMGREFTPEETVKADKLVEKNTEASQKYEAANKEVLDTAEKEFANVPSKIRGRAPTIKELGEMFSEKLREVCDV